MNLVILHGRLTKDVDVRFSQSNNPVAVANFSVAVKRDFSKQGDTESDFFNCVAFGKTAENIEKFFKKGAGIIVKGRLQNDSFQKDDGTKVTYVKVIVDGFDFAEKVQVNSEDLPTSADIQKQEKGRAPSAPFEEDDEMPF